MQLLQKFTRVILLISLSVWLTACGGGSGSADSSSGIAESDTTAPSIQFYEPGPSEMDVLRNSTLEIIFDEPLDCSTVNNNSILLNPFSSGIVTCEGIAINFTPSISLNPNSAYSVTINAGIKDLAGNPTSVTAYLLLF